MTKNDDSVGDIRAQSSFRKAYTDFYMSVQTRREVIDPDKLVTKFSDEVGGFTVFGRSSQATLRDFVAGWLRNTYRIPKELYAPIYITTFSRLARAAADRRPGTLFDPAVGDRGAIASYHVYVLKALRGIYLDILVKPSREIATDPEILDSISCTAAPKADELPQACRMELADFLVAAIADRDEVMYIIAREIHQSYREISLIIDKECDCLMDEKAVNMRFVRFCSEVWPECERIMRHHGVLIGKSNVRATKRLRSLLILLSSE